MQIVEHPNFVLFLVTYWPLILGFSGALVLFVRQEVQTRQNTHSLRMLEKRVESGMAVMNAQFRFEKERIERRLTQERQEMQAGFNKLDVKLDSMSAQLVAEIIKLNRNGHKE